jgi:hypothetical protein
MPPDFSYDRQREGLGLTFPPISLREVNIQLCNEAAVRRTQGIHLHRVRGLGSTQFLPFTGKCIQ